MMSAGLNEKVPSMRSRMVSSGRVGLVVFM